jgi:hypothetical protein
MAEKIYIQNDDNKIELTGKALADFVAIQNEIKNAEVAKEASAAAKAMAKIAVLERLGITAEEAALLLQ